jgi:hypothetical protein
MSLDADVLPIDQPVLDGGGPLPDPGPPPPPDDEDEPA